MMSESSVRSLYNLTVKEIETQIDISDWNYGYKTALEAVLSEKSKNPV